MGVHLSTIESRVTFVKGEETSGTPATGFVACGAGTAYPMEVTIAQIAELFHRVKDAWFTAGSATWKVSGSPVSMLAPTAAPTNRRLDISATTCQQRGYCKLGTDVYNGATYDAGIGSFYSDIATCECGIWRDAWNDPDHVDAFSYEACDPDITQGGDSEWWRGPSSGAYATVQRGDKVAVVRLDPADGVYAATNKFYLQIEMLWSDYGVVPFFGGTNIHDGLGGDWSAYAVTICQYILRLATGDATAQVYFATGGSTDETGTDFIHEAKLWWPYATSAGLPAWDTDTGAPANGGPGA
jgi:hypothetical protein